jgi:hypothetical protein
MAENVTPAPVTQAAPTQDASATPTPETTPVQAAPEPKQEKLGVAYAKLAREQKAAREASEKLKSERMAIEEKAKVVEEFEQAKANAGKNPIEALKLLGLTPEQVNDYLLSTGEPDPVEAVRSELEEFKRAQQEAQNRYLEEQRKAVEAEQAATLDQFKGQISQFIESNPDKYELTQTWGAQSAVFELIDATYTQTNRVLTIEEAADQVESYLDSEVSKLTATKKFSAKLAPAVPPTDPKAKTSHQTGKKSLSNQLSPSTSAAKPKALTAKEREQRAIAAGLAAMNTR